jgi:protein SCO1/2
MMNADTITHFLSIILAMTLLTSCGRQGDALESTQAAFTSTSETNEACCASSNENDTLLPPPRQRSLISGEFELIDAKSGKRINQDTFKGKHRLVFFGFTHCRVVCPLGMQLMSGILQELDSQNIAIAPLFISIDPQRDSAERMTEYLSNFDERIIGLVGNDAELRNAMRAFRIEAPRMEIKSETDYQFDHPSLIMLMDKDGQYITSIPSSGDAEQLARDLVTAMQPDQI